MTRRYGQPIQAQVTHGRIDSFIWRGIHYQIYGALAGDFLYVALFLASARNPQLSRPPSSSNARLLHGFP